MPTHAEQRVLPYTPRQLYDLVADVDRYPEFLPWCIGARVKSRSQEALIADLVIGFKMFRERYTSRVHLDEENLVIDVEYLEGPFKRLDNHWKFMTEGEDCRIDFYVDFEFRSRILQKAIQPLFNEAVKRMVSAFEGRARDLYGAPIR